MPFDAIPAIQIKDMCPDGWGERPDRICPVCKKAYRATSDWGYRYNGAFVCSWSCVMALQRRDSPPRLKMHLYPATDPTIRADALQLLRQGESIKEVARITGVSIATLYKWRQDLKRGLMPD